MELVTIDKPDDFRKHHKLLGQGSEGSVFLYDNQAIKIFHNNFAFEVSKTNKEQKLKVLMELKDTLNQVSLPTDLIYDKNGNFIGYIMDLIETYHKIRDFYDMAKSKLSLALKVFYYRELEEIVKVLHSYGIYLVDVNLSNFLLNSQCKPVLTDSDGFKVGEYKAEEYYAFYVKYYKEVTGDHHLQYIDEFSLTFRTLELLYPNFRDGLRKSIPNYDIYHPDRVIEYIGTTVDDLDIPGELRSFYIDTLEGRKHEFIGPYLGCISNPNKRYLKKKSRLII
ncbi:MAG TPA: hypothetical protein PLX66_02830 [Bacilli bacterium]|nr:hypothetical protein [Bacilli bacterium]